VILLSDIAISKLANGLFSVVTPGNTRVETSADGVVCLVWGDGSNNLDDAVARIKPHLSSDMLSIQKFIRDAIRLGLFYRAKHYRRHVFAPAELTCSLHFDGFRSLSEVNLCPSNECNLRCPYCNLWKGDATFSPKEVRQTLYEARQLGANILNILGGEPTLYPELTAETITVAKELGYERITVSINGTSLPTKTAILWKRCGLKTLQVSVDWLRGVGKSLEVSETAIKTACSHFSEAIIGYVYYGQDSRACLFPLVNILKSYPVVLDLKVMIPLEGEQLPITPFDIAMFSRDARKLEAMNDFIICPEFTETRYIFCGAGICHIFIEADGTAKPCGFINRTFGNVRKTSLFSIWLSEQWNYFYHPKPVRKVQCLKCNYRKFCIAGCAARFRSKEKNCFRAIKFGSSIPQRTCIASKVR
jgi:radical SAM protein with 4Fe4S-binding SPASM domain